MPSDTSIAYRFNEDKATLVNLMQMLSEEPPTILGITQDKVMINDLSNWTSPEEGGFSKENFAKYHSLMSKTGIKQLWRRDGATYFNFAEFGIAGSGWRLAFMHSTSIQSPLTTSVDLPIADTGADPEIVYRPLGDGWYIRVLLE
jgi:hypothetical protein